MKSHKKIIQSLSDKELLLNLYLSQFLMVALALVASRLLFGSWLYPFTLITFSFEAVLYGLLIALAVVLVEFFFVWLLPASWFDDGGVNDRMFRNRSVWHILVISLVVGISEEILFRGVLQTSFGIVFASIVFALIHFRYLQQPFLFCFTVLLSFLLGGVFIWTGNLLTVIVAHFFIDALLGLAIRLGIMDWHKKSPEL